MKEKLLRALKWSVYPAFYLFCLVLFGYLTFPFDRLKDRILSEIGKQGQGTGKAKSAPQVTIEKLDSYWFSGVELAGVKIRLPADDAFGSKSSSVGGFNSFTGMGSSAAAPKEPEKETVIEVAEAHARARLLPLLIGRVQLDFWASVFGGEVSGTAPAGASKGDVELALSGLELGEVSPLQNLLGIPIGGKVNGELSLSPLDGKFSKSNGQIHLTIKGLTVSDGKTKIQGLLAIPTAKVDEIVIAGEAEKGVLKITKLTANGPDLELEGDGKINLREAWADSSADIYLKFRFTDAYRGKDATTKSILGEPGSTSTPLIEMQVAKLKKAKRSDGFYGFHVHGKLKRLDFTPSATEVSGGSGGSRKSGKGTDSTGASPTPGGKKVGGISLPLGASTALQNRDKKEAEEKERKEKEEKEEREAKKEEEKEEKEREERQPSAPSVAPRDRGDSPPTEDLPIPPLPQIPAAPPQGELPPGELPPGEPPGEPPAEDQPR